MPYLMWILTAGGLGVALWALVRTIRDQPVIFKQLIVAGGVLAVHIVSAVVVAVAMARGHSVTSPGMFWGYIVVAALLFPLAGVWSIAERTRWSSVVLAVAGLAFAVVQLRLVQMWAGA